MLLSSQGAYKAQYDMRKIETKVLWLRNMNESFIHTIKTRSKEVGSCSKK